VELSGYPIRRVHWEPDGLDLKMEAQGDKVKVRVPELTVHGMVVAEL
jgi:hypothetical protein